MMPEAAACCHTHAERERERERDFGHADVMRTYGATVYRKSVTMTLGGKWGAGLTMVR